VDPDAGTGGVVISGHDIATVLNTIAANSPSIITALGGFLALWRQGRKRTEKLDEIHKIVNGNTSKLLDKIPDAERDTARRDSDVHSRSGDA